MASAHELQRSAAPEDFESGLKFLWLRAQDGDEVAYREALSLMAARLRRYYAHRMRALPDDVEDLVQETLLALHQHRGTYDPSMPVSAWMYAIGRHKMIDLLRRRGRRDALHQPFDELTDDEMPWAAPDAQPARRDLGVLLQSLPAAQRLAIVLTKIEGLSVAEAAARGGVSVSALKVQVHRGLKRLSDLVRTQS